MPGIFVQMDRFYMGNGISQKALKNAIKTYAAGVAETDVIALLDVTLTGNGKEGFHFYGYDGLL